jgi:Lon-like protease
VTLFEPEPSTPVDPRSASPVDGDELAPAPRRPRRVRIGWVLIAIAVVATLALGVAPAPYAIEQPGPVFNTLGYDQPVGAPPAKDQRVLISIPGKHTYPTSGSLDLLTVSVVGDPEQLPSWLQVAQAWFDPSKAVVPIDLEFPAGQTVKQQNAINTQEMVDSQQDAVAAALNDLGYDFPQRVMVKAVGKGTPAAGVLKDGDQITAVDGSPVHGIQTLRDRVTANGTDTPASIDIIRDGAAQTVHITPERVDGAVLLGVGAGMDYSFPFSVKIQLDNVGGPSAGQMFALGIIDKLSPGKLNGGARVAGTGTIDNLGNIGAIGGIRQKMFGARAAGATWFLAPASNCDEVTGHIPAGLKVFAVKKLSDSLKVLKAISSNSSTKGLPTCPTG